MIAQLPAIPHTPKGHPRRKQSYAQAVEMQATLQADIQNPITKPQIRAACVRAWDILEERKRILRGRPLPGHLRPDLPAAQRKPTKRVALLAEPLEDQLDKESTSRFRPVGAPSPGGGS